MTDPEPAANAQPAEGAGRSGILRALSRALWLLRRLVDVVALLLLAYMACAILIQIVGRYFFNYSIAWSEETATFAQIWLTLLGAGIAMRYNQHVGVDVLIRKAPIVVRRVTSTIAFALGAWFLGAVAVGSIAMVAIGYVVKSPALQIPMAIPYYALPIGFGYFLLEFALTSFPQILHPETSHAAEEGTV